jgi:hypothetical protein
MNIKKIKLLLLFVPNLLLPVGLYLAGDKNILNIIPPNGEQQAFNIPDDKKGFSIILNHDQNNPFYIYVNKNRDAFKKKIDPPADEASVDRLNLISVTDKKLLGILHYLLTVKTPNRKYKLKDTFYILKLLDSAIHIRTGKKADIDIDLSTAKWANIKNEMEEQIISKELIISKASSSFSPIQTEDTSVSDSE